MLLENYDNCITLELLDGDQLHALQTWTFADRDVITIGRSDDQTLTIANPHVSRQHLEMRHDIDGWRVKSLGRHGLILDGLKVADAALLDRSLMQLGPSGPTLRFTLGRPAVLGSVTMSEESSQFTGLQIDQRQKLRDVEAIVDGEYFRTLKQRAAQLRQHKSSSPHD
jgi:pSer/pThr/pTyr-binding forkhead associated (FHA) protein